MLQGGVAATLAGVALHCATEVGLEIARGGSFGHSRQVYTEGKEDPVAAKQLN